MNALRSLMDCNKAQSILNYADSDPDRVLESNWEALGIHLDNCPKCDARFRGEQELDLRIADVMRDQIEIPVESQRTVVESLQRSHRDDSIHESYDSPTVTTALRKTMQSHSRWKSPVWRISGVMISSAALLIALFWSMQNEPVRVTLDTIYNQAPLQTTNLKALPEFDNRFDAALPEVGWGNVSLSTPALGWQPGGESETLAALYSFEVRQRGRIGAQGVLLVIPKSSIEPKPTETRFAPDSVRYTSRSTQHFASIAWTEGDLVYVCFVRNNPGAIEALRAKLMGRAV